MPAVVRQLIGSARMEQTSPWNTDGKWRDMKIVQKLAFVGKFVIALCTFGFVFPNLFDD